VYLNASSYPTSDDDHRMEKIDTVLIKSNEICLALPLRRDEHRAVALYGGIGDFGISDCDGSDDPVELIIERVARPKINDLRFSLRNGWRTERWGKSDGEYE